MGGGTTVQYSQPQIEKDTTFSDYLSYMQSRDTLESEKQAAKEAKEEAAASSRKSAAAASYQDLKTSLYSQLNKGLITYKDAVAELRDYVATNDLGSAESDVNEFTTYYTDTLLDSQRDTNIKAVYSELLGREATDEEVSSAKSKFTSGYYSSVADLKDALKSGSEYTEKFNQSYLDNYYDTMFGKQTVDEEGKKTGKRTFTFDSSFLPTATEDLQTQTGIKTADYKDFTGTAAELEEYMQSLRDTRQYLYSAGLTNLQGEIDKETQKLKNEGAKEVQKVQAEGDIYKSLVSSFSFS